MLITSGDCPLGANCLELWPGAKQMPKNIDLQPAAQYLRVSTGEHPHSIAQQQQVISEYASKHHFKILRTYKDVGVSGLTLHGRQGFAALLTDVLSGNA